MAALPPIPGPAATVTSEIQTPEVALHAREKSTDVAEDADEPSWRAMCAALDIENAQEESPMFCSIARIQLGEFDFMVPQVAGVIEKVSRRDNEDATIALVDPSGRIEAYFHAQVKQEFGSAICVGATLLLQQVMVYVSGPGTKRFLNIHPDCIVAVFGRSAI